ncbi:MAG TPA: hydantoinase/oxoprolinase N-terminal domain-containing protein, partial [Thermodesulfovibrionia bacterium]|nr:hydantoinase/oxoprolinase N-terminal domain-containing protein [Thermodesulfovibrionia bacterium]
MADKNKFRFSIDRGGTFTDIYAEIPEPPWFMTMKLLSEDPDNYADAASEGIRRIMEKVTGQKVQQGCVEPSQIEWIRMGTTLATNALLERKGARTGLVITRGFGDLLQIGYQNRPDIFDLRIRKPSLLYEAVIEVNERVRVVKPGEVSETAGITGEGIEVLKKPDLAIVQHCFEELSDKGIRSVAVVLMNAYTFHDHEKLIGSLARSMGFEHVSLSHEVMPSVRIVGRGDTTTLDAYLTPKIMEYITSFRQGFCGEGCKVLFMQSYGGLIEADKFTGARAILSGPAGGVVGYAMTCFDQQTRQGVIGFDMGGT